MAGESDLQPAVIGEGSGCAQGSFDDGGEGAAGLGWRYFFGEHVAAGGVGEEMEGSAAVGDGAADCWIGAVGGDEPLLNGGVALGALVDWFAHGGPGGGFVCRRCP